MNVIDVVHFMEPILYLQELAAYERNKVRILAVAKTKDGSWGFPQTVLSP